MKQRNITKQVIYSILFAVIIYLALSVWGAKGDLSSAFSRFDWRLFPLLLALAFTNYSLRFIKWQYYLRILSVKIPRRDSFCIHLAGLALSITPGKMGEVVKSYFLKVGYNEPLSKTAPIVFADRLSDLMSLVILVALGAIGFSYGKEVVWFSALLILIIFLAVVIRPVGQKIIDLICRIKFLKNKAANIQTLYNSSYVLLQPKRIILPLFISLLAWSFEALAFYFVFIGFSLNLGAFSAFFIYSFSTIVGALSMLPGGLGTTEGSITSLLSLLNVNLGISVLATLIIRAATLWFAVLVGIVFFVIADRNLKDKIKDNNINTLECLERPIS